MKKLLNILFILIYIVVSVFIIRYHDVNILRQNLGLDLAQTMLNIKEVEKRDPNDIFNHILRCINKYKLTISDIKFDNLLPHQKQEITLYLSNFDSLNIKIHLQSGRLLNKNDNFNKYLSTINNTDDPKQVGVIKYFNKNTNIYIRPVEYKIQHSSVFGLNNFYVNTQDHNILKNLIRDLESKYKIKVHNFNDYSKSEILPNRYEMITLICLLYLLIFVIIIYVVFCRYKELAIYKMHGISSGKIFCSYLLKEMIKCHLIGIFISLILSIMYLLIFNGLYFVFDFLVLWLSCICIITLISLIIVSVPLRFLLCFIHMPLMLKNKTSTHISLIINYICKFVSVLLLINLIVQITVDTTIFIKQTRSINTWEKSKYLAKVNVSSIWKSRNTNDNHIDFGDAYAHDFFIVTNKKGGILIDVSNYKLRDEDIVNKVPYAIERSIDVNNNYLKLNTIYDVNNKIVDIPDHDSQTINLLVPEKFKMYDKEIRRLYLGNIEDINFSINIIYVKNNQSYFTYNLDVAQNTGYKINDPIVQVISNQNSTLGDIYYGCALTHSYYVNIKNSQDPFSDIKEDLIKSGLNDYVSSAITLYDMTARRIYNLRESLTTSLMMLILSILTIAVVTISISMNYFEHRKIKNFILKIFGFNLWLRYGLFYLSIFLVWTVGIFTILITKDLYVKHNVYTYLLCIIFDIIFSSILLKVYENKKISSVLKGE